MSPLVHFHPLAVMFLGTLLTFLILFAAVELCAFVVYGAIELCSRVRAFRNERLLRDARTDIRVRRGFRTAHRLGYLPDDLQ